MPIEYKQLDGVGYTFAQLPVVNLLGVRIHVIALAELLEILAQIIIRQGKIVVGNVNAHAMNIAYAEPRFRDCLNNFGIVFCDGFGVKWGGRILGQHIKYRYTPPDWIDHLSELCVQYDFSLFLLGGRVGVAEEAASQLIACFPSLKIVGCYHGYFDKTTGSSDNELVIQKINAVKPNILMVGFGMPLQEYWLEENWHKIQSNVALPVGAALDYISGEVRRGPRWMTDYGFEWLMRLIIEPNRLWRRYILGNPLFLWRVVKQRFRLNKINN